MSQAVEQLTQHVPGRVVGLHEQHDAVPQGLGMGRHDGREGPLGRGRGNVRVQGVRGRRGPVYLNPDALNRRALRG